MKLLIVGRSATGKNELAKELVNAGLKQVISYTTRPKRTADEDTHIFVNEEEAAKIKDRVASTVINGYQYFATRQQVEDSDVYIVDPAGFDEITSNMPDTHFVVIHMTADADECRRVAKERSAEPNQEAIWNARRKAEHMQFVAFEDRLERISENTLPDNCGHFLEVRNHFVKDDEWYHSVKSILSLRKEWNNLTRIVMLLSLKGILTRAENGNVLAWKKENPDNPFPYQTEISIDNFVSLVLRDNEGFKAVVGSYLKEFDLGRLPKTDAIKLATQSHPSKENRWEKGFLQNSSDSYCIYQLRREDANADIRFMNMEYLKSKGMKPEFSNYEAVYSGMLPSGTTTERLENLYMQFNTELPFRLKDCPKDFSGHSMSVSDVVVLRQDGVLSAHYADSIGFKEIPAFIQEDWRV